MKISLFNLLIALFLLPIGLNAQDQKQGQRQERKEEIKKYKIAYITEQVNLTSDEAQKFWPVYNEHQAKLDAIRKERRTKMKAFREKMETATDADIDRMIRNGMEAKKKELQLEETYYEKYKRVLPIKKVAKLYHAEKTFKKELLKKINQGQNGQRREQRRSGHPSERDN